MPTIQSLRPTTSPNDFKGLCWLVAATAAAAVIRSSGLKLNLVMQISISIKYCAFDEEFLYVLFIFDSLLSLANFFAEAFLCWRLGENSSLCQPEEFL